MDESTLHLLDCKGQALSFKAEGTPILFLHGLSYTIGVWQKIGVTEVLEKKQVPFLALDMPYGLKSDCHPKNRNAQYNVNYAAQACQSVFGDKPPVVVGASIGGYIALQYAKLNPVKGLFLIAPAHSFDDDGLVASYKSFKFPVRVVWGNVDTIISGEEMRTLTDQFPNAKMLVYSGAAHSAYNDQPERFTHDLLELYALATT
jgi:pimeloyl-ACP methyl ester carboxylesterase